MGADCSNASLIHCCGMRSAITDSREHAASIRRRRKCTRCGRRWVTVEVMIQDAGLALPTGRSHVERLEALLAEMRETIATLKKGGSL